MSNWPFVCFVLLVPGLALSAGLASWMRDRKALMAQYRASLDRRRAQVDRLEVMTDDKRRVLAELSAEVERRVARPRLGQPKRTEVVNVTSLNQRAGVTAGRIDLAGRGNGEDLGRREWAEGRAAQKQTDDEVPWPDRHPALYSHLPWPVRRLIITRSLRD